MMAPSVPPRDPHSIPAHVLEQIQKNGVFGFYGKGEELVIEVCPFCGLPHIMSSRRQEDQTQPNKIVSAQWMPMPSRCVNCSPIFIRYPEIALWVANVVAFREFAGLHHD